MRLPISWHVEVLSSLFHFELLGVAVPCHVSVILSHEKSNPFGLSHALNRPSRKTYAPFAAAY